MSPFIAFLIGIVFALFVTVVLANVIPPVPCPAP
jgi:hypothetical protein